MSILYYGYPDANPDERWKFWLEHRPVAVALDVETVSLTERHPLGIGIAFSPAEAFYFELTPEVPVKALESLIHFISDIRIVKIFHNAMFDLGVWPLIPVVGKVMDRANIFDTNIAARILGYQDTMLELLGAEVVDMYTTNMGSILKSNGCKDNNQLIAKNPKALSDHCAQDCKVTFALWQKFDGKIRSQYGEYFKVEMASLAIILDMSMHGIAIDQQARQDLEDKYVQDVEFYRRNVQSYGIDNPGSSQQVGYMLAKRGSFLKFTKSKKQLQTRVTDLEFLDDPLAAGVIGYRQKNKFLTTYLMPLKGEDRFYTEYFFDTVVGRLNSRNRNIQND